MPLQFIEVVHAVVGHADGAHLAGLDALDEGLPGALAVGAAAVGRVDEDEVEVVEFGLLEGDVDLCVGVVVGEGMGAREDLGGEEDGGAGDVGGGDAGGAGALVAVGGGGVDLKSVSIVCSM